MKRVKPGFTLIEILIVVLMLSVISLAVYASFNNCIKIWKMINQRIPEEDLCIFFEGFSRDLRNTFKFRGLDLSGKEDKIEFSALVYSPRLNSRTVGRAVYSYDPQEEVFQRQQRDFADIYTGEKGTVRQSLKNIKSLRFRYYFYNERKKEYLWEDEWLEKQLLPLAVNIELEFYDGVEIHKFTRTVNIPVTN